MNAEQIAYDAGVKLGLKAIKSNDPNKVSDIVDALQGLKSGLEDVRSKMNDKFPSSAISGPSASRNLMDEWISDPDCDIFDFFKTNRGYGNAKVENLASTLTSTSAINTAISYIDKALDTLS